MERKRKILATGLVLGLVVAVQGGCVATAKVAQPDAQLSSANKELTAPVAKESKPVEPLIVAGKVVETMNAGGYTYISLEKDGKKGWVAVPPTQVSVGQEIEVRPGSEMGKFTSKTLGRTFDNILFSSGLVSDATAPLPSSPVAPDVKSALPQGHPPMEGKTAQPENHMGMMKQPGVEMTPISGKVVETMDAGGYTYISLENGGKKVWAAVPTTQVTVGQELKLQPGAEMTNFKSKSLDRSFDSVIFSGGVIPEVK